MLRATVLLSLLAGPALAQGIEVRDAYAFSPRPGAPTGGAYMVIVNLGEADRLLSASSPAAEHVLLHDSVEDENGVMRMEEAEAGLPVPAGGELALLRGGSHVMLMGITDPLRDGETLPLVLTFEKAGEVAVEVPVDQSRLTEPDAPATEPGAASHEAHEGH